MSAHTIPPLADMDQLHASLLQWVRRLKTEGRPVVDDALLRTAFDDNPQAMCLAALDSSRVLRLNLAWLQLTAGGAAEPAQHHLLTLGLWTTHTALQADIKRMQTQGSLREQPVTLPLRGRERALRWGGVVLTHEAQRYVLLTLREAQGLESFPNTDAHLARVAARSPDMLFHATYTWPGSASVGAQDALCLAYVSPAAHALLGLAPETLQQDTARLWTRVHPQDVEALQTALREAVRGVLDENRGLSKVWQHAFRLQGSTVRWLRMRATLQATVDGVVSLDGALSDISAIKAAEESRERLVFNDHLTDLPNRRLMLDRIHQAQVSSARSHRHAALMFLDLDDFKHINDALGHHAGDEMLIEVAQRLSRSVREGDTASRFGGDEFVVMIENLSDHEGAAVYQAEQVGMKLLRRLNEPMQLLNRTYMPAASMGVVIFKGQQTSLEDLLKHADLAMYQAKSAGRNTLRFFEADMQAAIQARAAMRADIEQAIREGQFVLHYQPMFDRQKQVLGFEAYVRWNHPTRGLLAAREFMNSDLQNPIISLINDWALHAACEQLGAWRQHKDTEHLNLTVNISPGGLRHPDFTDHVRQVLRQTQANPHRLTLEFKEIQPGDEADLLEKMHRLRELGVRFALDDFGNGFTPLNLIKQMPLSHIKISRQFVQNLHRNPDDASMVRTMLALAQQLDLTAMGEGVETFEQFDKLSAFGCEHFQGYWLGRPEPLSHWGLGVAA